MNGHDLEFRVDKFIFRVRSGYLYTAAGVWVDYDPGRDAARVGLTRLSPAVQRRRRVRGTA